GDLLRLDQLAAFCGVSIRTSRTDVHLLFNYDSCYVKQEEAEYVLSLSWYGTEQVLSCPASATPPSIVCKNNAMEITIVGDGRADELSVALNGEWAPLLYVATECWHREQANQGQLTFSVPYRSCGVNFRDGHVILVLKSKGKMMPLSCPYEPIPMFPVKDPGLSETTQPLPQKQLGVYHKPPTVFPSQIVKQVQAFPVEQQQRNVPRSPYLHPRSHWLPKLPSLPGSFNLSVNFPFSLPIQKQPMLFSDHMTSKNVVSTPEIIPQSTFEPTPEPTPESTTESTTEPTTEPTPESTPEPISELTPEPEIEHRHPRLEPMEQFERPVSQSNPSSGLKYQFSRVPVPSTSLYQPFGSAQNYNFPSPDPLQVNPSFASLAQHLPPGYFICSYNQKPLALPEMFLPTDPNPAQPLQYQIPSYQKPDITWPAHANPALPPMNVYSQQPLTSAVASNPYGSGSQLFQPSQHHPHFYQGSYGRQGFTRTPSSPSPASLYPSYPAMQDDGLFRPKRVQQRVQQPLSTSHLPVKRLSQESKPLVLASSRTPEYLEYQTGGAQSLDLYQRPVVDTSGRKISSHSQYPPSQLSDDFSSPKGFFQPRSMASVPSPQAPTFTGNHPITSLPQPMPRFFPVKEGAQVAQLPYSQGPSVRGMRIPHVYSERPSEQSGQKPQNDTLPQYQFYRPASQEKDIFGSPQFRSTSQEVQPPRKASHSGSYFYSPSAAEALN
ncbi:hypothetical protein PO909_015573, partial [Leuciscus waleckii]